MEKQNQDTNFPMGKYLMSGVLGGVIGAFISFPQGAVFGAFIPSFAWTLTHTKGGEDLLPGPKGSFALGAFGGYVMAALGAGIPTIIGIIAGGVVTGLLGRQ